MKKQILFIFTALLSLALLSCNKTTEKIEIREGNNDVSEQLIQEVKYVEENQQETSKTFKELKQEADEANRKAKERIKFSAAEKETKSFEDLKREAEEATLTVGE